MTQADLLLGHLDLLIRTMPPRSELNSEDAVRWIGQTVAVVSQWNALKGASLRNDLENASARKSALGDHDYRRAASILHEMRFSLMLASGMTAGVVVAQGGTFDYFDEVRRKIELAKSDLLFVDPYINADFVGTFLPHVRTTTTVRLLTERYISQLVPTAEQFTKQHGLQISIRSSSKIHDRVFILDGRECFHSGASFKDGAKNAPTLLTPITDAFSAVQKVFEDLWATAKVEL